MKEWQVSLITAFGRGETLALALHENGFQVQVLDFTAAFADHYHRSVGPFPVVDKVFIPAQREFLNHMTPMPGGLSLWLKEGPLELNGPMHAVHAQNHPELKALHDPNAPLDFANSWLSRFLRQWTSPFFNESWEDTNAPRFPFEQPLGLMPALHEERAMHVDRLHGKSIDIRTCRSLRDARLHAQRIEELDVDCGSPMTMRASQWVWCLSSFETEQIAEGVAEKIFFRGVVEPEWRWISFEAVMSKGPWCESLPQYCVVIDDIYLPWTYANAFMLRRVDETRLRVWLKVPQSRISEIDARRSWALAIQNLLMRRLALAEWKVDSAQWGICPHSEVYSTVQRHENPTHWKNWQWLGAETLPRLDISARLEAEAACFQRLTQWRSDLKKKQGARGDSTLHAP